MDERERNIREAFIRMREFNARNKADYADHLEAAEQFAVIDSVIDALDAYAAAQMSGSLAHAVEKKSLLIAAVRRKMKDIARTARALNIDDEGFRRLFSLPDGNNNQKLLAAAREFAAQAAAHKAAFLKLAMPADFIDDLNLDITAFEKALGRKATAQSAGVGATTGIDEEIERGMNAATILNAMMKNVYRNNPVKLAEWTQARHVRRSARKTTAETEKTPV